MHSVGVNLLWLQPGVVGGSENYTLSLLRAVHELDPHDLELTLYARRELLEHHPDLGDRFEVVEAPAMAGKLGRVATEHTWLSRQTGRHELMHYAGGVIPRGAPPNSLVTILDVQPLDMPENFGLLKRSWLGQMIPRSVDEAKLVLVPSRFTADRLVAQLSIPPDICRVVPFGVQPEDKESSSDLSRGPLILYPAIAYAHKRHCDLIDAFSLVHLAIPDARLVLTGGEGPLDTDVQTQIKSLGLTDYVELAGRVSARELQALYGQASVMAFPSEYEGFGLPPLEAMNHGTPVVVADSGSLPEVVGDAARRVSPRDPEALAAAIKDILTNPGEAARLVAAGYARAASFPWTRSGEALIGAYRDGLA